MGPDDAELVRVYTRAVGGAIADVTPPYDANFEVVVDVEAGGDIFADATEPYVVGIVVRDKTAGNIISAIPPGGTISPRPSVTGTIGDGNWATQANQFVFTVPVLGAGCQNDVCEILAFLQVGAQTPDVSFATSPLFIIVLP